MGWQQLIYFSPPIYLIVFILFHFYNFFNHSNILVFKKNNFWVFSISMCLTFCLSIVLLPVLLVSPRYSSSLSAHHLSFCLSVSPPGSCSCMAPLRPPLPTPSAGQAVHGTCLSLDQAQSHPPGKHARVPVLPGPRPGLVRPATVHRRRLPSLHEGKVGITAALLHQGGEGAGEGNSGLLRPLSRSSPELPTHQW